MHQGRNKKIHLSCGAYIFCGYLFLLLVSFKHFFSYMCNANRRHKKNQDLGTVVTDNCELPHEWQEPRTSGRATSILRNLLTTSKATLFLIHLFSLHLDHSFPSHLSSKFHPLISSSPHSGRPSVDINHLGISNCSKTRCVFPNQGYTR